MDDTVAFMTASELVARYRAGDLSPVEATETALARLERYEPVLNAFQLVDAEGARAAAKASEDRWAKGAPAGPLDGVPLTIKDTAPNGTVLDSSGIGVTLAASHMIHSHHPQGRPWQT